MMEAVVYLLQQYYTTIPLFSFKQHLPVMIHWHLSKRLQVDHLTGLWEDVLNHIYIELLLQQEFSIKRKLQPRGSLSTMVNLLSIVLVLQVILP